MREEFVSVVYRQLTTAATTARTTATGNTSTVLNKQCASSWLRR
jgi:hypothetical protein